MYYENRNISSPVGFTLIELLLVVSLMTTLTVMGSVFFIGFTSQNAVLRVSDQLISSLRKAQIYTMMGKQNGQWGVHYGNNTVTLFQGTSYAARNQSLDESQSVPTNITLTGLTDILFLRPAGTVGTAANITITGNALNKTISINTQGIVSREN